MRTIVHFFEITRTRHWIARAGLLGMLWLAAGGSRTEGQDPVGKFGDVWRWRIAGAVQAGEDEVRRAVLRDLHTQLACHPLAPRSELATTVSQKIRAALQDSGFGEAGVEVRLDADAQRLCVAIDEGPRYVRGAVRIEGRGLIPVEALHERLTRPYPPAEALRPQTVQRGAEQAVQWLNQDGKPVNLKAAVWEAGKPAPLSSQAQSRLEREVREALEDLGYRDARFEVARRSHAQTRTADLVVTIADWGSPAALQAISVTGHERSSEAAILKTLDIRPGEVLTRRRLADLDQRLSRSGRFIKHHVTAEPADENKAGKRLKIELLESAYSAPLEEELGRESKAMLRGRDWLCNPEGWEADLVLTRKTPDGTLEMVLSPQQGLLVVEGPPGGDAPPRFVVVSTTERLFWRIAGVPQRLEFPVGDTTLELQLGLSLEAKPEKPDKPFRINMGVRWDSKKSELFSSGSAVRFSLDVTPSAALAFPHLHGSRVSWQGTELTVETERERIVIEEAGGRLLHYQGKGEENGVTIAFVPGAFSKRWGDLRPVIEELSNAFNPARPVSSCLEFAADALAAVPQAWRTEPWIQAGCQAMPMFRTMLERGILQDIDAYAVDWFREIPIRLSIPGEGPGPSNALGAIAGSFAFLAADTCFPHGSWMWTVCRESAFAMANEAKYLQPTLQQFYRDEEIGPVGALVVSWLVERVDPRLARQFALRGLRDTSVDGFRRDFLPLLGEGALLGKLLARTAIVLQEVDELTAARWIGSLPERDRVWLAAAVTALRQVRHLPVDVAIALALEQGWQSGLRGRLMEALATRRGPDAFPIPLDAN